MSTLICLESLILASFDEAHHGNTYVRSRGPINSCKKLFGSCFSSDNSDLCRGDTGINKQLKTWNEKCFLEEKKTEYYDKKKEIVPDFLR